MNTSSQVRLTTWKEIAAYIGRGSRTAKRYEVDRRLPVHRIPGAAKSIVYAFPHELDAWLQSADAVDDTPPAEHDPGAESWTAAPAERADVAGRRPLRWPLYAATAGVLALVSGLGAVAGGGWRGAAEPSLAAHAPDSRAQYLDGLYAMETRTPAGMARAVDDFTQAIVEDPRDAQAFAGLANCYNLMPQYAEMPPAQAFPRAKAAAERAIALAPGLGDAHAALGFVDFWWGGDTPEALRQFQTALRLDPTSAQTHHWYANILAEMHDPRAVAEIKAAEALNPQATVIRADEGWVLVMLGRIHEAQDRLNAVLAVEPDFAPAHSHLALVREAQGDDAGMLRELRRSAELRRHGDDLSVVIAGEQGLAEGGAAGMWRAIAGQDEVLFAQGRLPAWRLARDEARLGHSDRALALLAQAKAQHEPQIVGVRYDPQFAALRGDPRFKRLTLTSPA